MVNSARNISSETVFYPTLKKLDKPNFEPDPITIEIMHTTSELNEIQKYMVNQISVLNKKTDWVVDTLVQMNEQDLKNEGKIVSLENWKHNTEHWKKDTEAKINEMGEIAESVRNARANYGFLKGFGSFIISIIISTASTLGALYYISEKVIDIVQH